jgi:hypothetical protein
MCAKYADFSSRTSWKDQIYSADNGQGVYGAVIFEGNAMVGIFFDGKSERSPYRCRDAYDSNIVFRGMPASHRNLTGKRLLGYMEVVKGTSIPCITAAFWDEGEYLSAADPWNVVLAEGARVMQIELKEDINEGLTEWQDEYQMTQKQRAFARSLFNRRMSQPEVRIELTDAEINWLRSTAKDPDMRGIALCREKLAAIGVVMPYSVV